VTETPDFEPASYYDAKFLADPELCRGTSYQARNEKLLNLVDGQAFYRVFEFAGYSGLLAEQFINRHPETVEYCLTDFSEEAIKLARRFVSSPVVFAQVLDINPDVTDLSLFPWGNFDLVVTQSLEHLSKGHDQAILRCVVPGCRVLISAATFGSTMSRSHPHPFPTVDYLVERLSGLFRPIATGEDTNLGCVLFFGERL